MKHLKLLIILFHTLLISLTSCESNCSGLDSRAVLRSKTLIEGNSKQSYSDIITVDIDFADNSNYYISNITFEENLPNDLTYEVNGLEILFNGTPTSNGNFEFEVKVVVLPYINNQNEVNDLCRNYSTNYYTININ